MNDVDAFHLERHRSGELDSGPAASRPTKRRHDVMGRRTFMAVIAGGLFASPRAVMAQRLLRYEGRVLWIAGSTLILAPDQAGSIRVDLTRVSQSEYAGLVPRDRIIVSGMLSEDGNYLVGLSIERTRLEYESP